MSKLENTLVGEKALAEALLLVLPLVEKHFKDFDGERAAIKSGSSAKFSKLSKAFREEADEIVDNKRFRIYVDTSVSSVYLKADIAVPNSPETVAYYRDNIYFGKVNSGSWNVEGTGEFTYDFDEENYVSRFNDIVGTTEESLEDKKAKIKALKAEISKIEDSVPYHLRDALK